MQPILYPYQFESDPGAARTVERVAAIPNTASYRVHDERELAIAKGLPPRYDDGRTREDAEFHLHYCRWRISGRNTFLVGPETTTRIMTRLAAGDVPTAPVPPAYIEFETPPLNFGSARPLRASFISRGEIGRITLITDGHGEVEPHMDALATTLLLPSVLTDRDLDNLKRNMAAVKPGAGVTDQTMEMARAMAKSMGGANDDALRHLAGHLGTLSSHARGEEAKASLGIAAHLFDQVYGPSKGKPNPLLPKAARIVLIAADEARRADAIYGGPRYLDTGAVERNWMESKEMDMPLRSDVVRLP